jgi:hypothetical protein
MRALQEFVGHCTVQTTRPLLRKARYGGPFWPLS